MIDPGALSSIREGIDRARKRAGLEDAPPVEIVAVTKGFPKEAIDSAYRAGLRSIGETRVQEAGEKMDRLPELPGLTLRMIGHLQSNKARKGVSLFDTIDSVDSVKLGKRISRIASQQRTVMPVLLQVNTGGDPAKFGFSLNDVGDLIELVHLPGIRVEGLMTIGALTTDTEETRRTFRRLRQLRDQLNEQLAPGVRLHHLSMGMTADFKIAVEEGATMVRIGTALFGPRPA
ncbi:MAG: YggS family pyridoxal phosphate-dependent enzyme [Fidelibacterota bacterium]